MTSITQVGAVLEAIPVHHKGYFRTNLFIEPTGTVHVLSTHDRVVNANNVFGFIACSFPQTVVPYEAARVRKNKQKIRLESKRILKDSFKPKIRFWYKGI